MEAIRKIVEGKILNQVVALPVTMHNKLVEVIILPVEHSANSTLKRSELRAMLSGSHTESLSGALPSDAELTVAEVRRERRAKYERAD